MGNPDDDAFGLEGIAPPLLQDEHVGIDVFPVGDRLWTMPSIAGRRFSKSSATYECSQHLHLLLHLLTAVVLLFTRPTRAASYYSQHLADSKAVHLVGPSGGDDAAALQQAINQVQETRGQGIVFVPEGRYRINNTLYVWPGIRLIGYGPTRPVLVLPANTPGFQDASHEKVMVFFAGNRSE